MLYEILFAWITVWSGGKLILHHHSFRYLDFPFTPMKWLTRAAGPQASHVVLCEGMKHALQARYEVKEVLVLTNAAFFEQPAGNNWKPKFEALLIGHLANLSPQKGLFDVLELAEMSRGEGVDLRFEIAGPFETPAIEAEFHKRVKGLDNVKYLGALYEQKKLEFFQRIDVFVFPTRYRNEAEPLVVFEALSQGCPVIAYDRGCISSQVDERCGLLVPPSEVFARLALSRLRQWQDSTTYQASRVAAHEKFQELRKSGLTGLDKLLENLRQTENISEQ